MVAVKFECDPCNLPQHVFVVMLISLIPSTTSLALNVKIPAEVLVGEAETVTVTTGWRSVCATRLAYEVLTVIRQFCCVNPTRRGVRRI